MPTEPLTRAATDFSGLDLLSIDNTPASEAVRQAAQAPATAATQAAPKAAFADLDLLAIKGDAPAPGGSAAGGDLFGALLHQESGGRQFDKQGKLITSSAGALGIAQVMPGTAPEAARLAGVPFDDHKYKNDADYNAKLGRAYYNKQLADFGDPSKALAAYNAGPGAMRNAQARASRDGRPDQWLRYLPQETQQYVPSILARAQKMAGAPAPQESVGERYLNIQATPTQQARTLFGGVNDTVIEFANAAAGGVKAAADFVSPGSRVAGAMDQFIQSGEASQSDAVKADKELFRTRLEASTGIGDDLSAVGNYLVDSPLQVIAQAAGSFVGPGLAVKGARGAAGLAGAGAKGMSTAGLTGGAAAGAALSGGDAAGTAYELVMRTPDEVLSQNPQVASLLAAGMDLGEIRAKVATEAARQASVIPAVIGAGSGLVGAERILAGVGRSGGKKIVSTGLVEGGSEAVEEGATQYEGQRAAQAYNPEIDPAKNVAAMAAMGAAMGGITGAGVAALSPVQQALAQRQAELAPVAEKAAQGGALSKAALAGNTGAAADAEFAANFEQAAADQQLSEKQQQISDNPVDTLAERVKAISELTRANGTLDALRQEQSPIAAKQFVTDLAMAQSTATPLAAREQALGRLEFAAEWAGANPAPEVSSGVQEIVGQESEGLQDKPAKSASELRAGVDRDAKLQGQINQAGTVFDQQNLQAQAAINRSRTLNAPQAAATPAAATPAPITQDEQNRLADAAASSKADERRALDAPRQAVINQVMTRIQERGGVASPAEAQILREANLGQPYDRVDPSLAPELSVDERLQQATGITLGRAPRESTVPGKSDQDERNAIEAERLAAQERANAAGTAGIGKRIEMDGQAKPDAAPPTVAQVMAAFKVMPFQRSAADKAVINAATRGYSAEQVALMERAANNPASLSAQDRVSLRTLEEAQRSTARVAAEPGAVNVATPRAKTPAGPGPAIWRKRRETFSQLIADGLNTVERRHDGNFYLVNNTRKRQFKLDGMADAQLARKAVQDAINQAANQANTAPTPAQASAGNYKKGRVDFDGLQLGIENPVGSERKGTGPDGTPWSVNMIAHYGDLTGTNGKDGDGVDTYLVANPRPGSPAFVIDQYDGDTFDEHKVILGVATEAEALKVYDAHFSDGSGPLRRGAVTPMSTPDFKAWAFSPAALKPAGAQRAKAAPDVAAAVTPDTLTIQMNGQAKTVTLVSPAKDGSAKRPGAGVAITPENATLLQAMVKLFGKQVDFFSDPEIGDGFVTPDQPSRIFLNEKTSINPMAVFGHEFLHHLERELPQAHAALVKVIGNNLPPAARAAFRQDYYRDASGNTAPLQAAELNEITSDIGGNLMTDAKFWGEVFAQIEADHPTQAKGLIAELAARLMKLLDQLMATLTQPNFKSTELVTDINAVRAEFKQALAQYMGEKHISPMGMQAQILRATQAAKTAPANLQQSATRSPAPGIHFSQQERSQINGSFYGTGMRGAEAKRLMNSSDPRLKTRAYFYIDEGQGVKPESGVGGVAHEVNLPNLYDARANPERLWDAQDLNATEARILDAGYAGYYVRDIGNGQGAAVVMGQAAQSLPAKRIDLPGSSHTPALPAVTQKSQALLAKDLNAVQLDAIPGASVRHGNLTVPLDSLDAANDELMRIGSNVRFSPARAADSLAAEYAAVEKQYKGTAQWLKAPNGQPTLLDERQWVHVRTPAFKAWFGDWEAGNVWARDDVSKAVGENGEPLVVYHGADNGGFTVFNRPGGKERGDLGIWTTPDRGMAGSYVRKGRPRDMALPAVVTTQAEFEAKGFTFTELDSGSVTVDTPDGSEITYRDTQEALESLREDYSDDNEGSRPGVYALFVNLRNPQEESFEGALWNGERPDQYVVLDEEGDNVSDASGKMYFDSVDEAERVLESFGGESVESAPDNGETTDSVVRDAIKYHSDGAIIRDVIDDGGGVGYDLAPKDIFIAFEPNQLKSADFNNGAYSVRDDDVRLSPTRKARDPAVGDKTDVAALPKGKPVPASVGVGSLALALQQARSKKYTTGRQLKLDLQSAVLAAAKDAKVDLSARNQENFKFLAGMVLRDAELALQSNENAIGWYDTTVSRAIGALATVHPEIESEPVSRLAFLWALATTSNGLKVDKNFELAEAAYGAWKTSHHDPALRIMPSSHGVGNAASTINKGLKLFNTLADKMGHERLFKFMATEFQVGQIAGMFGTKPGGEWQGTPVLGSAVLGPKIGNGFFSNLNGYFDALTIDRWLMRTWGRLTGTLIEVDPKQVAKSRTELADAVAGLTEAERRAMSRLVKHPVRLGLSRAELVSLAKAVSKSTMKPENRDLMNVTPAGETFRKAGNQHHIALDGQKEAPSGPAERNWMRAVFAQTLADLQADGKDMTMADLQALLWYPERRLYDAAKSEEETADGYEDDEAPDYANAAQKMALAKGVSQADITRAMDAAQARGTVQGQALSPAEKAEILKEFRAAPKQGIYLAFEVAPNPDDAALVAQWGQLSLKDRTAITKQAKESAVQEVADLLAVEIGNTVAATGGYEGSINPNLITEYQRTQVSIDQARALSSALGLVLDQKSVALVDPRASDSNGMVRVTLDTKAAPHAAAMLKAIQAEQPTIDAFTARGNNFDVLNFTGMTTEELARKISEAMDQLGLDVESQVSFGDTQSELVFKDTYEQHIQGLRPGAGQEIRGGVERIRDRIRAQVAAEIRSASAPRLDRGARPPAQRPGAVRRDAGVQRSPSRSERPGAGAAAGALQTNDATADGSTLRRPDVKTGREFTGFFSNISLGFKGQPGAKAYEPVLNVVPIAGFVREYNQHRGHFDDHIASSIPGFRELQTIVGAAIAKTYGDADMLDIGASEGALVKTVTKLSDGGVRTVALDPNFAMAKHFNDGEAVPGSVYDTSAFGSQADEGQDAWTEDATLTDRDGQVTPNPFAGRQVKWYQPDRQFDVVHEAMVFQFISGDRAQQVGRAKELMKPNGVLILEEKFVAGPGLEAAQFRANEAQKDAYKEQYFTKAEIAAKAKAVGVAEKAEFAAGQQAKETAAVGMNDLMVSPGALESVLDQHFRHVAQFWDAGNFKGYLASDSRVALDNLLGNMLPTSSEFATTTTPRHVPTTLKQSPARRAAADQVALRKRVSMLKALQKCLG